MALPQFNNQGSPILSPTEYWKKANANAGVDALGQTPVAGRWVTFDGVKDASGSGDQFYLTDDGKLYRGASVGGGAFIPNLGQEVDIMNDAAFWNFDRDTGTKEYGKFGHAEDRNTNPWDFVNAPSWLGKDTQEALAGQGKFRLSNPYDVYWDMNDPKRAGEMSKNAEIQVASEGGISGNPLSNAMAVMSDMGPFLAVVGAWNLATSFASGLSGFQPGGATDFLNSYTGSDWASGAEGLDFLSANDAVTGGVTNSFNFGDATLPDVNLGLENFDNPKFFDNIGGLENAPSALPGETVAEIMQKSGLTSTEAQAVGTAVKNGATLTDAIKGTITDATKLADVLKTVGTMIASVAGGGGGDGEGPGTDAAKDALGISRDMWNYYKTNYQPLETELIGLARDAGTQEEFARNRGVANADVTGAFDTAQKNTERRLQSYGLNPGAPAYQAGMASTDLASGAARAGALTMADRNTRTDAFNKKRDVVSIGRGLPVASANTALGASAGLNSAGQIGFNQNQQLMRNVGYGIDTLTNAAKDWFGRSSTPASTPSYDANVFLPGGGSGYVPSTFDPDIDGWANGGPVTPLDLRRGTFDDVDRAEYAKQQKGAPADGYNQRGLSNRGTQTEVQRQQLKSLLMKRGFSDAQADAESRKAATMRYKNGGHITPHMRYAGGGDVGLETLDQNIVDQGATIDNATGEVIGPGTGTSDSVPAVVDGQQPAALSSGEFVMVAEVPQMSGDEILEAINQAGLRKRNAGLDTMTSNDVSINAGTQAYVRGGRVRRYGLGGY